MRIVPVLVAALFSVAGVHCGDSGGEDGGSSGGRNDAGSSPADASDGATTDVGLDGSPDDATQGDALDDGASTDGGDGSVEGGGGADAGTDAGSDGSTEDAGTDAGSDGSTADAADDAEPSDASTDATDGDVGDAGTTDGGGGIPTPLVCENHAWNQPVPAAGSSMMAYGSKGYLFAQDGQTWAVIESETALSQAIPFPSGITEMRDVKSEIAPSGRPLVTFLSESQRYGAFFDGQGFVKTTLLGQATSAHADAQERIFAVTQNGLTEFDHVNPPIVRGALPYSQPGWTVGADGTVYVMYTESRPSTIHPGDTAIDLKLTHLDHGSLTWTGDAVITSNEGWGFSNVAFVAAPDGSLHVAYALSYEAYYYRTMDGVSWEQETFKDIVSKATLVDYAAPVYNDDPAEVKGNIRLLAAQDYEHVSITMIYAQGSFSVPSFYFLRRCPPFSGIKNTWPAERLGFSGLAFDNGAVAVSENGLPSILTPNGVRQDVVVP